MPLDPAVVAALAGITEAAPVSDIIEIRRRADEHQDRVWPLAGLDGPDLPSRDHVITTPGHPDAVLRLLYPAEPGPAREPWPICLSLFGGAWQQGGLHHPSFIQPAARRAARADVIMACLSYALAPEHPYPAALDQGVAALDWIVAHAGEIGADPTRIAVDGTSAGGNLAAALTLRNRAGTGHPLRLQILEVPALDLTGGHLDWSEVDPAVRPAFEADFAAVIKRYLPAGGASDPYVSPLLADDLTGLPPAYILTCELDPLRGDGEAYAAALAGAGVPVAAVRLIGADHGSHSYDKISLGARAAQDLITAALRSLHD